MKRQKIEPERKLKPLFLVLLALHSQIKSVLSKTKVFYFILFQEDPAYFQSNLKGLIFRQQIVTEALLTLSLISPSFQGDPTIFHRGIFLKQTPHSKNLCALRE